jgi:hypothetical protein
MKKNLTNFFLHPRQIKIPTISEKICRNFFYKKIYEEKFSKFFSSSAPNKQKYVVRRASVFYYPERDGTKIIKN